MVIADTFWYTMAYRYGTKLRLLRYIKEKSRPKETNRGLKSQNHRSVERWFCDYLVLYVNKENKMPVLCLIANKKERETGWSSAVPVQ
jgi:hypothetical protein